MKKRLWKIVVAAALFCFALFGVAACSKPLPSDSPGGGNRYDSIDPETIKIDEQVNSFIISWEGVEGGERYTLKCGTSEITVNYETQINLRSYRDFVYPTDGVFNFELITGGDEKNDSVPTEFSYTTEGPQLPNPNIISFEEGILTWEFNFRSLGCSLKVNGTPVSDGADGLYHASTLDTKAADYSGKSLKIDLTAVGDNLYFTNSSVTAVVVNAAHTKLVMQPVTSYSLKDGVLSWNPVGGASGYRILDINNNVITVPAESVDKDGMMSYDLNERVLVAGVYPISSSSLIGDAELTEKVSVQYLNGSGTAADPYVIRTPFELRAIDYYETEYVRAKAIDQNTPVNHYRIDADIDFSTVAAGDEESNIYTLSKPFYGVLDGNSKTLSNLRVRYDGGYWALFDMLVKGSEVKNIKFDNVDIVNKVQVPDRPIDASIATVAQFNYGKISGITLSDATYTSAGGAVCGICSHNYGTVENCTLEGENVFTQANYNMEGQACYEMAGVVLENCSGGKVTGNNVVKLKISGTNLGSYNNVRLVGGIVGINRSNGTVTSNRYTTIEAVNTLVSSDTGEYGGIVGYNGATSGSVSGSQTGTFKVNGASVTANTGTTGTTTSRRGKIIGLQG